MILKEKDILPHQAEMRIKDMKAQLLIIVIIEKIFDEDRFNRFMFFKMEKRLSELQKQIRLKENSNKIKNMNQIPSPEDCKIKSA